MMQRVMTGVGRFLVLGTFMTVPAFGQEAGRCPVPAPTPVADALVAPVSARKEIEIGGERFAYRAAWTEMVLKNDAGEPQATISATSYIREDVDDRSRRPVMFLFNGGPGASSTPLHFSAFGPRRRTDDRFVDNEASLLDVTDLVFIDPVGTGFSRELTEGGGRAYWSVNGDAQAVLALVRNWLHENGRDNAPVFFAGESYGGTRLAVMSKDMGGLNVRGLLFLSPATDLSASGGDQHFISTLPSMAVAAWAHGKAGDKDATAEDIWEEARFFAQGDYAVALQDGAALPAEIRSDIAGQMSSLIGLPTETIEEMNIRVGTQGFLEALLADEDKILGRLDTRVTAPKRREPLNADRPAAANDPSLGLGRTNVIKSESAATYFRNEIGVETTREYYSLTLDVNFNWDWRTGSCRGQSFYFNVTPNIARLMNEKQDVRAMVVGGYFDLATPVLAQRYAFTHAGVPLDRVDMFAQAAPHSPFDSDDTRNALADRVRDFIRQGAE